MPGHVFTIEELMLDDGFVNYCLSTGHAVPSRWKKIIRDHSSQEKTFEEAKRLVLALHGGLSRPEVNRQIEIVRRQLDGRKNEVAEPLVDAGPSLSTEFVITNKGKIKRRFLKKMAYSGLAICIMITGVLWWSVYRPVANTSSFASQPTQVQNYHSPLGQRKKINLADGSLIILNSNSSISVAFTNNKREVRLNGDAFFEVAKDEANPFIVYAKNVAATVMGTKFYVHGRKDDETSLQVDLLEGKVQMVEMGSPTSRRPIILNPGESGRFGEQSSLEIRSFDSFHLRSWITGHIYFNETPLMKAVKELENWYGIKIEVWNEELKNKPINGNYIDEPLQNILDMICFNINSRYSIKDNRVIIE
jgi:ferric-dicitrate binding protein FerR (iron transport regulator)